MSWKSEVPKCAREVHSLLPSLCPYHPKPSPPPPLPKSLPLPPPLLLLLFLLVAWFLMPHLQLQNLCQSRSNNRLPNNLCPLRSWSSPLRSSPLRSNPLQSWSSLLRSWSSPLQSNPLLVSNPLLSNLPPNNLSRRRPQSERLPLCLPKNLQPR